MDKIIEHSIEAAMQGQVREPVVSLKVRRNGKPAKVTNLVRYTEPPHVGNEVVRIINGCDPVGFLNDVVNGLAIECHVVDVDGKIHTYYETANLNQRISTAKFLGERYLPKVAVIKHAHLHKTLPPEAKTKQGSHDTRQNFDQILTHAANQTPSGDD